MQLTLITICSIYCCLFFSILLYLDVSIAAATGNTTNVEIAVIMSKADLETEPAAPPLYTSNALVNILEEDRHILKVSTLH